MPVERQGHHVVHRDGPQGGRQGQALRGQLNRPPGHDGDAGQDDRSAGGWVRRVTR